MSKLYQFYYNVPDSHLEVTKKAIFQAGAGKYNDYDQCCFQIKGQGQFNPLNSANPYIGKINQIEYVDEYKVETIVQEQYVIDVIKALKESHPYEEVPYGLIQILTEKDFMQQS